MKVPILTGGAFVLLAGCASAVAGTPLPGEEVVPLLQEQRDCMREERVALTDRAADINPTPQDMTVLAFELLHSEISRVREATGSFPSNLEQLLVSADPQRPFPPRRAWLRDGWRRRIYYTPRDSVYVLSSAGSDGVPGNGDDLRSIGPLRKC